MLRDANAIAYRKRFLFGKDGSAGIAFFLRIIPVLVIARKGKVNLSFLQFSLLNTECICIDFMEEI